MRTSFGQGRVVFGWVLLAVSPAVAEEWSEPLVAKIKAQFQSAFKCNAGSSDLNRHWCPVGQIGNEPFSAPASVTTLLGVTMEVRDGAAVGQDMLKTTSLSAMHLGAKNVRVTSLKPSNADEQKELAEAVFNVGKALKGQAGEIAISKSLAGYLDQERRHAGYPLTVTKNFAGYVAKLPSRIYRSGHTYVVLEKAAGGAFVSVFTDGVVRAN
jgi:hypothetical protein